MKTFIKVLIVLGILAIVLMLGVNYFISKIFERETVVFAVEESVNTRFDVQDISVNIFSTSPSIKFEDVKFAPRDEFADDQVEVKERPEITSETVYLSYIEAKVDIPHLIKTENEIISEVTIGEGTSISSSGILNGLKSSLSELSEAGLDLNILSDKLILEDDLKIKTLFIDGKVSFLEDLNLVTADCDIALKKESWVDLQDNTHKFQGTFLLSEDRSKNFFSGVDELIDEKTSKATDNGYTVDKKMIKDKLFQGMVKNDKVYVEFTSQGDINDPEFKILSMPSGFDQIIESAVREAIK